MARSMTVQDKEAFLELERRERFALRKVMTFLNARDRHVYELHATQLDSDASYDAILFIKDKNDNVLQKYVVEVKNRSNSWDDLIYEHAKHVKLTKIAKANEGYDILYINISPEGTYMFPISEMTLPKMTRMRMKHESFAKIQKDRDKRVYLLPRAEAIHIPVAFSEYEYQETTKPKPINPKYKRKIASLF